MPLFGKRPDWEDVKKAYMDYILEAQDYARLQNRQIDPHELLQQASLIITSDLAKQLDKDQKGDQIGIFLIRMHSIRQ